MQDEEMDRQTEGDRRTDRQIDRGRYIQTKLTDRHTDGETDRQTHYTL